jgi:hypothetical protein
MTERIWEISSALFRTTELICATLFFFFATAAAAVRAAGKQSALVLLGLVFSALPPSRPMRSYAAKDSTKKDRENLTSLGEVPWLKFLSDIEV